MRATLMNWRIESLLCVGKVFCTIDGVLWINFSVQLINEALRSLNRVFVHSAQFQSSHTKKSYRHFRAKLRHGFSLGELKASLSNSSEKLIYKTPSTTTIPLFKNERFMLNASKFAIFLEYENPSSFFHFSFRATKFFP